MHEFQRDLTNFLLVDAMEANNRHLFVGNCNAFWSFVFNRMAKTEGSFPVRYL